MKYARRDATIYTDLEPIDRNDPDSANSAIEYGLPTGFSGKAHACWEYFSGAAYLFEYKGQLVITDESLELTEYGDGSHEAPFGAPRGTFDTWEEVEEWLEAVYDDLMEEGRVRVKVLTVHDVWHGVTYAEDKQEVVDAMRAMKEAGAYPGI